MPGSLPCPAVSICQSFFGSHDPHALQQVGQFSATIQAADVSESNSITVRSCRVWMNVRLLRLTDERMAQSWRVFHELCSCLFCFLANASTPKPEKQHCRNHRETKHRRKYSIKPAVVVLSVLALVSITVVAQEYRSEIRMQGPEFFSRQDRPITESRKTQLSRTNGRPQATRILQAPTNRQSAVALLAPSAARAMKSASASCCETNKR